jgi:hypothetical protein
VAVVRPRGVAASGKVVLTLRGKAKAVKRFPAALDGGKAAGCADLGALLAKRLKGSADMKALAPVVAAKLCGKPAPPGADQVLSKLALGPEQKPASKLGGQGPGAPRPGTGRPGTGAPAPTPTPAPSKPQCANNADDDGDGQTDFHDPGCLSPEDTSENSEVPVPAECAQSSGVSVGEDRSKAFAAVNHGCGEFEAIEIHVPPGIVGCEIITADKNFGCELVELFAWAASKDGRPTDLADVLLDIHGHVTCDKLATIALHRPNGEVAELREQVQNCGGVPLPACQNGKDDDGDGTMDSRDATTTTDPDPGCSSPTDTSENTDVPSPPACNIQVGIFDNDPRLPGISVQGCGAITEAWFKPPGTPVDCLYKIGAGAVLDCTLKAGTGGATFAATSEQLLLAVQIAEDATCKPVTVGLTTANGTVYGDRVNFC